MVVAFVVFLPNPIEGAFLWVVVAEAYGFAFVFVLGGVAVWDSYFSVPEGFVPFILAA